MVEFLYNSRELSIGIAMTYSEICLEMVSVSVMSSSLGQDREQ